MFSANKLTLNSETSYTSWGRRSFRVSPGSRRTTQVFEGQTLSPLSVLSVCVESDDARGMVDVDIFKEEEPESDISADFVRYG